MPRLTTPHTSYGSWDDETSDLAELLELLDQRPTWHRQAACRGGVEGVDWFAPGAAGIERAKEACADCPVLDECRAWALEQGPELHGVWGGLSKADRSAIKGPGKAGRRRAA